MSLLQMSQCSCFSSQLGRQRLLCRSTSAVHKQPEALRQRHRLHRRGRGSFAVRSAAAEGETTIKLGTGVRNDDARDDGYYKACAPEDLPKGERREFTLGGQRVLMFWYRNSIIAIEPRSPAEGAYSEGFISAKLTQDNCIECPSTSSLFDLTTGEIKAWYPNNPVLRLLTPQDTARNMIVYPVKLESDAILVEVGGVSDSSASTRGGAGTSSAGNNIYALQPEQYVQGSTVGSGSPGDGSPDKLDGFTVGIAGVGFVVTAATGTTISLVNKSYAGLAVFWAVLSVLIGLFVVRYFAADDAKRIRDMNNK